MIKRFRVEILPRRSGDQRVPRWTFIFVDVPPGMDFQEAVQTDEGLREFLQRNARTGVAKLWVHPGIGYLQSKTIVYPREVPSVEVLWEQIIALLAKPDKCLSSLEKRYTGWGGRPIHATP